MTAVVKCGGTGALEIKHAKVEGDAASTDLHCSFPCISGPPKVMAKFDKSQPNEIISDSNALISVSAKLASITNATLTLESPLEMIKFEPVFIGKDQATVKKKSAGFNSTTEFSFNSKCTTRQAALGITVLTFSNEN